MSSSPEKIQLQAVPALEFTDPSGDTLVKAELLKLVAMIVEAESGLERTDPNFSFLRSSRFACSLNAEFHEGKEVVSVGVAYQIAEVALQRMKALRSDFQNGRK